MFPIITFGSIEDSHFLSNPPYFIPLPHLIFLLPLSLWILSHFRLYIHLLLFEDPQEPLHDHLGYKTLYVLLHPLHPLRLRYKVRILLLFLMIIYLSIHNTATTISHFVEPQSYFEAVKHKFWIEAMQQEIQALESNGTWEVVSLPPEKTSISCKWVYKVKYHSIGTVERFKARLVAKGYNQKKGDLRKEVFMTLLEGFCSQEENRVCRLLKSLYGLKQASRRWNLKLTETLVSHGYIQCNTTTPCLQKV